VDEVLMNQVASAPRMLQPYVIQPSEVIVICQEMV